MKGYISRIKFSFNQTITTGFTMLYTPRGPVMDYTNERLVSYFMAELKKFGKKNELYL